MKLHKVQLQNKCLFFSFTCIWDLVCRCDLNVWCIVCRDFQWVGVLWARAGERMGVWLRSVWCWHLCWRGPSTVGGLVSSGSGSPKLWWWRLCDRKDVVAISPVGFPIRLDYVGAWLPAHLLHSSKFIIAFQCLHADHLSLCQRL